MLRKKALPLLATAALVPGSIFVAGCGSGSGGGGDDGGGGGGVDVAKAADATAGKGTAKVNMTMTMSGAGLKEPTSIVATGVTDLREPKMSMSMDLNKLMQASGAPVQGDAKTEIKVDGKRIWVKVPNIEGLSQMTQGKKWITLDLAQMLDKFGVDANGIAKTFNADPASQIRALTATKSLKEVGKEEIDGEETTHFAGKISARESLNALSADQKAEAEKAIKKLEDAGGADAMKAFDQKNPVDIWVDGDNVVRRQTMSQQLPSSGSTAGGEMKLDYKLSEFGADLDLTPPPAGDTLDVTQMLLHGLKQLDSMGGSGAMQAPATP